MPLRFQIGKDNFIELKRRIFIMSVLIEANNIVVRIETIEEKYPGGVDQYIEDCPNRSMCMDDEIIRIGFLTLRETEQFVRYLESLGFRCVTNGQFDEIAALDQFEGFCYPCDWLDFTNTAGAEHMQRISACKIKGASPAVLSVPQDWEYETSISRNTKRIFGRNLNS